MKKASKNLGITKACPECKKILLSQSELIGVVEGVKFKTKCKHCGSPILVEIGQKPFITVTKIKIGLFLIIAISTYQICTLTRLTSAFMALIQNNEVIIER